MRSATSTMPRAWSPGIVRRQDERDLHIRRPGQHADGEYLRCRRHAHGHDHAHVCHQHQGQDIGDELASITYPGGQYLKFTYNPQTGQRTQSMDQSGFTVNYAYDTLGRLSELTDASDHLIVKYTYNNVGELETKLNGNGTSTTYAYDPAGDLTRRSTSARTARQSIPRSAIRTTCWAR